MELKKGPLWAVKPQYGSYNIGEIPKTSKAYISVLSDHWFMVFYHIIMKPLLRVF